MHGVLLVNVTISWSWDQSLGPWSGLISSEPSGPVKTSKADACNTNHRSSSTQSCFPLSPKSSTAVSQCFPSNISVCRRLFHGHKVKEQRSSVFYFFTGTSSCLCVCVVCCALTAFTWSCDGPNLIFQTFLDVFLFFFLKQHRLLVSSRRLVVFIPVNREACCGTLYKKKGRESEREEPSCRLS